MLSVEDCLDLFEETFLVGETQEEGTVCLHPDVWDQRKHYELLSGEKWKKRKGWWYRWYDSGRECLTENDYHGPFDTAREAFDDAYSMYGPQDDLDPEGDAQWKEFERTYISKEQEEV
jgi:hypothetical protein